MLKQNYSLADFLDIDGCDIMQRAAIFNEQWWLRMYNEKHLLYRREALSPSAPVRTVKDRYTGEIKEMLYFGSNDYLNLANHPKVIKAGMEALNKYGAGAGSVPLLGGTIDLHKDLESKIAELKGCENAIIHTSGYGSNTSTLLSLLNKNDIAIIDILAHASLIDGCKNTNIEFFNHNDCNSLESILSKNENKYRTKLIIIDGVYSMDGDITPLDKIVDLSKIYNAYVMIDEAHSTGVLGENGRGTPEHFNLLGKVDIVCGTFSKALGGVGGFIAGSNNLIKLLQYYSRGYMFSTAMTPQVTGSLIKAIEIIGDEPDLRLQLWDNIKYFKKNLLELGFNIGHSETAIFPIITANDAITREICRELHEMNIYANPVVYPAVRKRLSRIRLSLMSNHTKEHLDIVLNAMEHLGKKYDIIK
ncbi:aminotransferase class I/II-fold pyridoxal phosphate-dependent enzyme [Myroides marinus]|nr:aminotransferase class I/II-fold pyridoxal phosphate-dependent enzyme [Myroides marinus]